MVAGHNRRDVALGVAIGLLLGGISNHLVTWAQAVEVADRAVERAAVELAAEPDRLVKLCSEAEGCHAWVCSPIDTDR